MQNFRHIKSLSTAALIAATTALYAFNAQAERLVMLDPFPPTGGWAMETDDAFTLARAGCLESLTRIDFDQRLQPSLATSWKQSSPTTWDFSIRQGVKFHDGQELNVAAVVNSLNRVLAANTPARSFNSKVVSKVESIDAKTVRITTPSKSVLLPLRLAAANTGIVSPASYKEGEGTVNVIGACTGPFAVTSYVPKQKLDLVRNDTYWGGKPGVAEAEVRYIKDGNTRVTQLKSGEAHIATKVPLAAKGGLEKNKGIVVTSVALPRTTGMYLNNKKAPFNNPLIRKAVQAAIDTSAIAASAYEGVAVPAIGPFAKIEPWAGSTKAITRDVARAKALLAEAGIKEGELSITLRAYNSRPELVDVSQIIQQQLKEAGISVAVIITDWAGMAPSFEGGTYDMAMMSRGHQLDVADPLGFLQADYTCEGGFNMSHVCNPEIDALLENAASIEDNDKRFAIYKKVSTWLQEEAITVFIVHNSETNAWSSKVKGFRTHPLNHYYMTKELSIQ
jgi:peptide/nickel transport system substrate-binding protein